MIGTLDDFHQIGFGVDSRGPAGTCLGRFEKKVVHRQRCRCRFPDIALVAARRSACGGEAAEVTPPAASSAVFRLRWWE